MKRTVPSPALLVAVAIAMALVSTVSAVPTTGGVNWRDPLGYTKPAFRSISVPTPGANQYWVNLSTGSGTTCTSAAPCSWATVQGKPGTRGDGGAYIYIRGTGAIGSPTLYGTAGNEVVIKPWNDTTLATITGRNNWTTRIQHVIFDGGPNLQIKFNNNVNTDPFNPSVYFNGATPGLQSYITFYRTEWTVPGVGEYIAQWGIIQYLSIINSEFQSTASTDRQGQHQIYFSGASNYGPSAHIYILGNVFRDTPGEMLEFRMFQNMDDVVIDGNVFHNIGKGTCAASWKCRPAITVASTGATVTNLQISNNLFWDLGEGAVRMWTGSPLIYNNSVWKWGAGTPANGGWGQWAFYGPGPHDGSGTIRNNIIYGTGSTGNGYALVPFDNSPFVKSNNVCASATTTGCGRRFETTGTNQTVVSLDPNNSGFMVLPNNASTAYGAGMTISPVTRDYFGLLRATPYNIGAAGLLEQLARRPAAPQNVRIVR